MKTITPLLLLSSLLTVNFLRAEEIAAPATPAIENTATDASAPPAEPGPPATAETPAATSAEPPLPEPPLLAANGEPGLRMNFRGVPLEMVLNYLSEAAGFIIVLDAKVSGKVDAWSNQPLTKDEAVNLLNTVLAKNGYTAIRNGRTLTIVNRDEAKTRDVPVKSGSDPAQIPKNDGIVTQILPVRFVSAVQLIKDLQPLVPTAATMTANEAGNAIIITDSEANIHRIAEIIHAIDSGAEDATDVRVFHLTYADPTEMAELLSNVFPDESKSSADDNRAPVRFGGGGGPFGAFFGRGGGGGNTAANQTSGGSAKKKSKVIAVADLRTSSVIVSATANLMEQIAGMVAQLDANPAKKKKVFVYSLQNADVRQVEQVLQDMFPSSSTANTRNSSSQTDVLLNRSLQNQSTTSGTGIGNTGTGGNRNTGGGAFR
jgi:type II secretory pathway component GspD/PulD (secretin)